MGANESTRGLPSVSVLARGGLGGVLMGLANLVPGISGGTMLLATGVYAQFVGAVAEVTTLRFRLRSVVMLGVIGLAAVAAIGSLAGPVKDLVETRRWVMYSLFIGLTLGGVPVVWRMARPAATLLWVGTAVGFGAMMALPAAHDVAREGSMMLFFLAGLAGASAMVLPGISGAYLLLVLGQYERILGAVKPGFKALLQFDFAALTEPGEVLLPVGIGVVVGVVAVSNLVRWALDRHRLLTLGILLGILLGSVRGIYPFQEPVAVASHKLRYFDPTAGQAGIALALAAVGFVITLAIDRIGNKAGAD